jgi:hypothetical protein
MLRFSDQLTPAATAIFVMCLDLAADEFSDFDVPEAWQEIYPRSAKCFTPELARATLVDLVEKLRLPEEYVLTDYHWLLMYECLQGQIAALNEDPLPPLVNLLAALATAQDALYLTLPPRSKEGAGFSIDFDALVDMYFWDTDFLMDPEQFTRIRPDEKTSLGFSPSTFGVIQGLAPHPDELVLRRSTEFGNTRENEQEEDDGWQ